MGIGMVVVVPAGDEDRALEVATAVGEEPVVVGRVGGPQGVRLA